MKILNRTLFKKDKEKFKIPRSVQDAIPIDAMWEDGIFLVGKNKYSKCFKFTDINYSVASREDKEEMFLEYSELLNSFDTGATSKITIINRRLNKLDFQKTMFIKLEDDELDKYRKEYNKMLLDKATASNGIVQEKCITITIEKKNIEDARLYFLRIGTELINKFKELGSVCVELEAVERLQLFHDFYRVGEETAFNFDFISNMRKGHSFKDYICPDTFEIKDDYIKIGNRYARVLFLKEYANYIKDSMVAELTDINKNSMMSIDVIPIAMDEAVREAENRRLGVETNITNWQRRQNANNNFSAIIPYDLEMQREQSKEFLDDLITRDQRMFMSVLTMVHTAETKEELDNDTEEILTIARKNLCQFGVLKFQQLDGLNTAKIKGDEIEPTKESIEKILNIEEYFTEHINIQRNSINGYLKNKKGERYFFKLLKNDEAYKELQGYFLLLGKFNISEMYEILKYKNYSFIIFKYDSTIDTDKGLLNDFLVENDNIENLKEEHYKSIRIIINELLKGIKEKITLQDYPMKKFFNDRIDNRLKKWYKENLIIEFQKKKYYLDEIILKTERYFKTESYLECFLSQGDPNVLNIGTKPILFDYTTSGYNSIIAEFCTCTWSILFNDLYFAPKYHKASYYNHEKILTESRQYNNLIKYEIYQNIVKITEAQIKTTKIRKIFMLEYIENLKKENVKIGKEFIFYMAMRILCIFNLNEMDQTDKIYSLYILIALIEKTEENSTNDMIEIIEKFILELEEF